MLLSYERYLISACLLRIVLPACLLVCVCLKQSALCTIYLLILLVIPFIPVPTHVTMRRHSGWFLKFVIVLSVILLLAQLAFQVVLLIMVPYGNFIENNCKGLEPIFRYIGFIRLNGLSLSQFIIRVSPEFLMFFSSIIIQVLCHKINNVKDVSFDKTDPEDSITTDERTNSSFFQRNKYTFLTAIGKYLCLLLLCFAGILKPTVINAIYFLIFLFCVTWWAYNRESKKLFAVLCRISMLCIFVQILALYFYQISWFQEQVPADSLASKLSGLSVIVITNCTDPRIYQITTKEAWPSFALPFVLVTLYYILWFESSLLLSKEYELELQKLEKTKKYKLQGKPGSLHRISTNRWRSATRKVRIDSEDDSNENSDSSDAAEDIEVHFRPHSSRAIDNEVPTEHTPLIRNHESIRSRSRLRPESAAKDAISDGQRSDIVTEDVSDAEEDLSPSMAEYLMDALMTISHFVTRTSYIATNIIMMSWSIMFHSWLTFVLLIWAIILWMLPNQRKIMLRSSPFLVLYAELLLLSQYLYELGFLDFEHLGHDNIKNTDKYSPVPVKQILIKTLFTSMFLLTLRQYIEEKREAKKVSAVAGMMAPLQDFVVETHSAMDPGVHTKGSQVMKRVGEKIRSFLTKFWIWVVAQILFAIGIMGDRMTIFRIIYMALALVFILTFQLSWHIWRKMMYEFWLTVIIYSMVVLVSVYTYQFDHFKEYWTSIGISPELQLDIGLELFDTTELFVRLLTPTFFVIITCIQLYYFHKDFLAISDIKSRGTSIARDRSRSVASRSRSDAEDSKFSDRTSSAEPHVTDMEQEESDNKESTPRFNLLKTGLMNLQWRFLWDNLKSVLFQFVELFWLYLELHMIKIILLSVMLLAVFDACALHLVFVLLTVVATVLTRRIQVLLIHIMTIIIAVFLLLKMIYQIQYISHDTWNINCTTSAGSITYNSAELLGFYKTNSSRKLPTLLKGYICIIIITTLFTVVMIRQKYQRHLKGRPLSRPFNLFPRITYKDADRNLTFFTKYLLNFFFYRFGIEITLISMVIVISNRMDVYALIYAVWLLIFVSLKQESRRTVWLCFIIFMVILIPLQYTLVVALPPYQCFGFPWCNIDSTLLHNLQDWLFLAEEMHSKMKVSRVLCDFILLLIASRQAVVFRIEKRHQGLDYVGGSNESIIHLVDEPNFNNPTPDFISSARGWLDIGKRIVVQGFLWLTLAFIFLTGTHRITFFSLGYLIGAFIFLWLGNDLYLRPIKVILKWWDLLLLYNVLVILSKTSLQVPACLFIKTMQERYCWIIQLLEISCINKLHPELVTKTSTGECRLPINYEGLAWDGFTFLLLILQRRLFNSHYFFHVIDETKAMAILASRGAELIEELSQKQILEQQETERKILEKIKYKMDRIKASQKRIQGPNYKEPATHFLAIRSGDYYMFDDVDEELDLISEGKSESKESFYGDGKPTEPTVSELLTAVMKTDIQKTVAEQEKIRKKTITDSGKEKKMWLQHSSSDKLSLPSRRHSFPLVSGVPSSVSDDKVQWKSLTSLTKRAEEPQPSTSKGTGGLQKRGPKIFLRRKRKSSPPQPSKDPPDDDESTDSSVSDEDKQTCGQKIILYLKFVWHFINSVMVSLTKWLNKFSRDYRYVIRTLSVEKKLLKEKKNFGVGVRTGKYTMWQPLAVNVVPKSSYSPAQVEELENKREMSAADQPPIVRLILALWFAGISHSELVCYFMIFIHHIESATILSLPLPLMVFLWGTLTVPRPTKTFWVTIIAYTEVMIVIKSVFQLELIPWNQSVVPENVPFYAPRIIGIERQYNFATYDLFLLLIVFFHRWMLKSLGLWTSTMDIKKVYQEIDKNDKTEAALALAKEKMQQNSLMPIAPPSNTQTLAVMNSETDGMNYALLEGDKVANTRIIILKQTFADPCLFYPKIVYLSVKKHLSPMKIFFQQLLTSSLRVTADVYTLMFFCDFFNLLVVIFGVASFGSQLGDGGISQYFQENKIPFAFLVMLIIQFGLIIVDRTLYLRKYIFGKIIFQYFLILGVHVWMFFILPAVTERKFNATLPPQMWYLVKCLYLLLSAYQIRSGYPTRILGNCLCKNYNILNLILFKIFMLIPFVFELRALMDWVWTDTSMSLNDWLTLEDIFAHIFQLKCLRRLEAEYPSPRGAKTSAFTKYLVGGGCLVALIAVIWFPLVLFSLGNTVGEPNLPYEFKMDIRIGSFEPIYSMSAQSGSIVKFSQQDWTKMASVYKKSRAAQNFLSNYDWEDVGVVKLSVSSASLWTISPPGKQSMIEQLTAREDTVDIKLTWTIQRLSTDPEHPSTVSGKQEVTLDKEMRQNITKMLENNEKAVGVPRILPKFIKITGPGNTYPVNQLMMNEVRGEFVNLNDYLNITLRLNSWPPDNSTNFSWSAAENCSLLPEASFLNDIPLNSCPQSAGLFITIYTFNDKAFPATLNLISGKGIIGLYTTFVIVVHTFVRGFFTGISFKIMFDDVPNVDRILQLCLDIYLVRESGELDLEEDLFAKLVFLYRSPETLIKWTRPPEEVPPEEDPENLPQLSH